MIAGAPQDPVALPVIDVEEWRGRTGRAAVVRRVASPTVVLGSRQRPGLDLARRAEAAGAVLVGRRSGGTAVALEPAGTLWVDLWLPAGDPLWQDDVSRAALWVGAWWARALRLAGARRPDLAVHAGSMQEVASAAPICFASRAPGELLAGGRKVMGIAQWRCRAGALFQCVAYRHWDPVLLTTILAPDDRGLIHAARGTGTGIDALTAASLPLPTVVAALRRHGPPGPPFQWDAHPLALRDPGGPGAFPVAAG